MVREWGMSDRVGPMAWSGQQQVFLGEDLMTSGREYSDNTAKLVDEEIARILTEQEARATSLLGKHRRGLELIAESLLEHETIDGPQVGRLIQQGLTESGDHDTVRMNVLDPSATPSPPSLPSTDEQTNHPLNLGWIRGGFRYGSARFAWRHGVGPLLRVVGAAGRGAVVAGAG